MTKTTDTVSNVVEASCKQTLVHSQGCKIPHCPLDTWTCPLPQSLQTENTALMWIQNFQKSDLAKESIDMKKTHILSHQFSSTTMPPHHLFSCMYQRLNTQQPCAIRIICCCRTLKLQLNDQTTHTSLDINFPPQTTNYLLISRRMVLLFLFK